MIGSDSAECTLAAGFLLGEIEKIPRNFHHAGILVHDHHAAGSHHGTGLCERIEINGRIQKILAQTAAGRPPDLNRFEFFIIRDAAADVKYQGSQRHPHGYFHQSGMDHVSDNGKNCGSGAVLGADASVPGCAMGQYGRNGSQGFYIVD